MSNNVQDMQIFTIIDQIEDLVENSPKPKIGGATKRVIDVDEVIDLLGDLKVTIPEDIRRANGVITEINSMREDAEEHARETVEAAKQQADAIISDANTEATAIYQKARAEYERLVSEDETHQEAERRANLLTMKAEANAAMVFDNAKNYADDVLKDLESFLAEYKQLVAINRRDLGARGASAAQSAPMQSAPMQAAPSDAAPSQAAPLQAAPSQAAPSRELRKQASRKPVAPVDDDLDDDYDDYDDEDEDEGGSLFSKLFKKKKANKDIDE